MPVRAPGGPEEEEEEVVVEEEVAAAEAADHGPREAPGSAERF